MIDGKQNPNKGLIHEAEGESSTRAFVRVRRLCGAVAGSVAAMVLVVSLIVLILELTGVARASQLGDPPRGHDAPMAAFGAVLLVFAACSLGVVTSLVLAIVAWICDRKWGWVCIGSAVMALIGAAFWGWLFSLS
jgi:hypothetical protein